MSARFCGDCGVDLPPNDRFCTSCGAPNVAAPDAPPAAAVTQAAH
ncbi:zinc-ribbon domain-containing protein, partial [Nocardioides sp. GCM10030258]